MAENAFDRYVLGLPAPKKKDEELQPVQPAAPELKGAPATPPQPAPAKQESVYDILRLPDITSPVEPADRTAVSPELQKAYSEADVVSREQKTDRERGEFMKGVYRGSHGLASSLYGAAALLGEVGGASGLKEFGVEGYKAHEERAQKYAPAVRLTDIDSVGSALKWAAGTLGELVPSMTEAVITSTVGALAGTAAAGPAGAAAGGLLGRTVLRKGITDMVESMVGNGLKREVAESAANRLAYRALGTKVGIVGGVAPLEIGGNYMEALEKGVDSPLTAIATGLAAGFLEIAGGNFRTIEKVLGAKGAKAFNAAVEKADTKLVARILKEAATQAPQEFAQEASQEALSMANMALSDPTFETFTKENALRLLESGAAGAVGGVAFGAVGGVVPEKKAPAPKPAPLTDASTAGKQIADEGKPEPPAPPVPKPEPAPEMEPGATKAEAEPEPKPEPTPVPPVPLGTPGAVPEATPTDEPEVPYFGQGGKVDADRVDFLTDSGLTWEEVKTWPIERREDLEAEYVDWRDTRVERAAEEAEGGAGPEDGVPAGAEPGAEPAAATPTVPEGEVVDEAGRTPVVEPEVPVSEVVAPEGVVEAKAPPATQTAEELRQDVVGEHGEIQWEKNRDTAQSLLAGMADRSANPSFVRDKVRGIIDNGGTLDDVKKVYSVKDATSSYASAYAKQYAGDRQRIIDAYHEANQSSEEEKTSLPENIKGISNKDMLEAALTVSFIEDGKTVEGPLRAEFQRMFDDLTAEGEGKAHQLPVRGKVGEEAVTPTGEKPKAFRQPSEETLFLKPKTDGTVSLEDASGNALGSFKTPAEAAKSAKDMGYKVSDTHMPEGQKIPKEPPVGVPPPKEGVSRGKKEKAGEKAQAKKEPAARDRGAEGKEAVRKYTGDEDFLNDMDLKGATVEVDAVRAGTEETYRVKQTAQEALDNNDRYSECLYELRACLES